MPQTGYTPIQIYSSSTPTTAPSAGNLTNDTKGSELAINIADKNLFFKDSSNVVNTVPIRQSGAASDGWLSSTDWNTFNNKQPAGAYLTSVTADSPLSGAGTSASHLVIAQATTSTSGYLSSTDWNTFNGKQAALVSGTNIKTVSGTSLLGSGDLGTIGTGYGGTGLTSFTANGIVYASSTSALATGSALTFDGTNFATTGIATAARFVPSGSTIPTNGMYLPAANTLAFSTNSAFAWAIGSDTRLYTSIAKYIGGSGTYASYTSAERATLNAYYNGSGAGPYYSYLDIVCQGDSSWGSHVRFLTNPLSGSATVSEVARINANGIGLNGEIPTSGVGIKFPATQSASSDANTLDDYEEGTFTPTIVYSGTNTPSYASQLGRYTKIGRIVQVQIWLSWNENGSTGNVTVGALPFTSVTSNVRAVPSIFSFGLTGLPTNVSATGFVNSNATTIFLCLNDNAATTLSATYTTADQDMYLTVTYEAA